MKHYRYLIWDAARPMPTLEVIHITVSEHMYCILNSAPIDAGCLGDIENWIAGTAEAQRDDEIPL
jgi:hypothetical protein